MKNVISRLRLLKADDSRNFLAISLLFALAVVIRAISSGFEYLPILDDSIQYINYQLNGDSLGIIKAQGLFSSRPLAAVVDLFFVGKMNGCLLAPVILFSAMHGIAGALFMRLFKKIWGTGIAFAVVYSLLPLGVEGTYWLSASSRIVFGLFFAAVAANILEDYIDKGKWWRIVLFSFTALLSYGFYEQILVVSFTLSILQFLRRVRTNKRAFVGLLSLPLAAVYFLFTSLNASDSALGSRISIALPTSRWYFDTFLPDILGQIKTAFVDGTLMTLFKGFVRGINGCFEDFGGIVFLALALAVGAAIYFIASSKKKLEKPSVGAFVWGLLLFLAPITPFLIIGNPWFSLRATVPSFIGMALIFDSLLRLILRRERIYAAVCAVLVTVFMIAGASEVRDYHTVGEYDSVLAQKLLDVSEEMSGRVGILGLEEHTLENENFTYHEHIGSVGGSDWALKGKLTSINPDWGGFTPVPLGSEGDYFYKAWNRDTKRISGFDELWLWDDATLTFTKMKTVKLSSGEHDFEILFENGTPWGRVTEDGTNGYIEIYE
ncbi:MAG: hypothetical protein IJY93_09545 [Clostridia bacterium]|nr:hypothetical protein [Clostridia bacterium]